MASSTSASLFSTCLRIFRTRTVSLPMGRVASCWTRFFSSASTQEKVHMPCLFSKDFALYSEFDLKRIISP